MRLKFDHVGIAVADLSGPKLTMEQLGLICTEAGQLGSGPMQGYPGLNARWAFYGSEGERAPILLLQPLSADGPIHDFLQKHNAGAQHLAFSVDDLDRVYDVLFQAGVRSRGRNRLLILTVIVLIFFLCPAYLTCCSS